ncbi:MAG TPA: ferritin family protein [Syntrophales bacterium]|nr:ferritin family protein [Syntrophales bacterium]HNS54410.1 ferritin family protein [Syntrophales bacterium]
MSSYQGSDIFQFAIRMEENGEKFYNYAASLTKDAKVHGIFTRLASEEVKHRKLFADMFSKIDTIMPKESYPGEYMAYLQASIDGKVFSMSAAKELADVKDVIAALDYAIGRELDSVLYYSEMKKYVTDSAQGLLEQVIDEERKHVVILSEIKKNL